MQIVIDSMPIITVGDCKRIGLFRPGCKCLATGEWSRGDPGHQVLAATITADLSANPSVVISYRHEGREEKQTIGVCYRAANYGRERSVLYFVCPVTGRLCRNLYFVGGKFVSRFSFRGLYISQTITQSRRISWQERNAEKRLFALLEATRRRLSYNGKPTRYAKQLDAAEKRASELGKKASFADFQRRLSRFMYGNSRRD